MAGIFSFFKNKLAPLFNRNKPPQAPPLGTISMSSAFYYGTIIKGNYYRFKHDMMPTILVLFSGVTSINGSQRQAHYTLGINLNYLNPSEKKYIADVIIFLAKNYIVINTKQIYYKIKNEMPSITRAYRSYFTSMLRGCQTISPGFFKAIIPITPNNDPYIIALNNILMNKNQEFQGTLIKDNNEVNKIIEDRITLMVPPSNKVGNTNV